MGKAYPTQSKLFKNIVPYYNFVTPNIIGYYQNSYYVMELSEGNGADGEPFFGVTVANLNTNAYEAGLSRLFPSREVAMEYMNKGVFNE